jgi:two-component system response regulator (stage 0 sporulation protein F)
MAILIVDDEKDVRESIREVLNGAGYDVVTASSGKEALEFVNTQDVSMMLVDFSMPEMTGEDLLMHLEREQKRPPALVITALAPWRMTRLMEAGVGYMRKPLNNVLLLSTIKSMLSKESATVNEH